MSGPKKSSSRAREVKERLIAVRVPQSLLDELDQQLDRMNREAPWVQMTRSDAVRWLLTLGLRSLKPLRGAAHGSRAPERHGHGAPD